MRKPFALITLLLGGLFLTGCNSTGEKETHKPQLANPGDELSVRPWGQGTKSQHYGTPFGLPESH